MLPSPNARWKRITLRGPGQSPALTFAGFLSASIRILANPNRENGDKAATDQRLELTSRTTIQAITIAVDHHSTRLDRIEQHLGLDAQKH
jgi:hypothetical protein